MDTYYSPSERGFYRSDVHATIPGDAVPVTEAEHAALMQAQTTGKHIVSGPDGRPIAQAPTPPPPNYEVPVGVYRKRIPAAVKTALLALARTDAQAANYLQSLAVYDAIDVDSPEHGAALDYLTTALAGGTGEITPDLRAALEAPL